MVTCPVCDGAIDVDEEDVDEGDTVSCYECGADLKVVSTAPLELESAEEVEEEEEEDDDFVEDEARDYDACSAIHGVTAQEHAIDEVQWRPESFV